MAKVLWIIREEVKSMIECCEQRFFFLFGITVVAKFEDDPPQAQIIKVNPEILQKICQKYIGEGSVFQTIPKFKVS
jgi:hypothetical protein